MNRLLMALGCIVIAVPLLAAGPAAPAALHALRFEAPMMLPPVATTYGDLVQNGIVASGRGPLRPNPNVVLEGPESVFVFPIVGSTAGSGGTFFRSETLIINRGNHSQNIYLFYFPVGGGAANCNRPAIPMRMDAQTMYLWVDFVAEVFKTSGLGAVIVMGVNSAGQPDSTAFIDGNSRIWTPEPGTLGTASQNFPSMSLQVPAGGQSAFGVRGDEAYRVNWGIFNYDVVPRTFDITVNGFRNMGQFAVTIDACSLIQQAVPGGPYGSLELIMVPRDGRGNFYSYGSSVDNVTGDSWSVVGRSY
jgi:hypothetical protein